MSTGARPPSASSGSLLSAPASLSSAIMFMTCGGKHPRTLACLSVGQLSGIEYASSCGTKYTDCSPISPWKRTRFSPESGGAGTHLPSCQ